jgi:nucleolar protein 4
MESNFKPTTTQSRSICVKNLPPFADDLWMYRRFSHYGAIHSVRAMLDQETQQCQGLGFVNFINYLDAQAAIANMNGAFVDGKRLVVEIQRPRRKPVATQEVETVVDAQEA